MEENTSNNNTNSENSGTSNDILGKDVPNNHENQDSKPSNQDSKPSNQDSEPSNQDSKPSNQDSKPSNQDSKPSNQDSKPSNQDSKPSNQDSERYTQDSKRYIQEIEIDKNDKHVGNHAEFREIDISEPSDMPIKILPQTNPIGLSVVENITSFGKNFSLREWSRSTMVLTKQLLSESFGFGTKTVDVDIERQIDMLEESKKACNVLLIHCQNISKGLAILNSAQKEFGQFLSEMSVKESIDYKQEMACNGEIFKTLHKSTSSMEGLFNMFGDNVSTLVNKTIDDCIQSIRQYDGIRIEYDAYRVQYEEAKKSAIGNEARMAEVEDKFQSHSVKFNKVRADVCTKMKLMEENKNKVLKRNLMILQETLIKRSRETSDSLGEISSHYEFKPSFARSWLENNE